MPLSFDVNSLRPEQILTWNDELHGRVVAGKSLSLNSYLRFEEAVYLPGLLDRIRSEAQRDQVEYGFAQLRLVLCFLRWSNLKEKPPERFDSPLVLLPVQLVKKKGVRDTYSLETLSTDAEINPVLRYYFKQLYDISLPEALDLTTTSLDAFHEFLAAKVQLSEPAITVAKIARPRIQLIHAKAQRRLDQYIQRTRLSGAASAALTISITATTRTISIRWACGFFKRGFSTRLPICNRSFKMPRGGAPSWFRKALLLLPKPNKNGRFTA